MSNEQNNLEEDCENEVFQICCTRERYSARCSKQLEKQLELSTNISMLHVEATSTPNFKLPDLTEEQKQFLNIDESLKNKQQTYTKSDERNISNRMKELKSIVNGIERSRNCEMHQLLQAQKKT